MADNKDSIEERLNNHLTLKNRVDELLNIVENVNGDIRKADDAEEMVIESLRKMGNEVLHRWAKNREQREVEQVRTKQGQFKSSGKKK